MKAKNVLFSARNSARVGLCVVLLGGVSLTHAAVVEAPGFDQFLAKVTGNSATVGFSPGGTPYPTKPSAALGGTSGWSSASNFGIGRTAGGVAIGQTAEVALAGGKVPVTLASAANKASVLKGFGKAVGALSGGPVGLALFAAVGVIDMMAAAEVELNKSTSGIVDPTQPFRQSTTRNGYTYVADQGGPYQSNGRSGCDAVRAMIDKANAVEQNGLFVVSCAESGALVKNKYGSQFSIPATPIPTQSNEYRYGNWDTFRPEFESADFPLAPLVQAQLDAKKRAEQNGIDFPWGLDVETTVTGPASLPTVTETKKTTRTVVGSDGISREVTETETKTTARPVTYGPDGVKITPQETTTTKTDTKNPDGSVTSTTDTKTTETDTDKPAEDESDLCAKYPDILACAKPELDTPDGELPKETKTITYQEENLFGGGSCPANSVVTLGTNHQTVTVWDWQKTCEMALPLRAIVISLATFAAFLIVMPGDNRV